MTEASNMGGKLSSLSKSTDGAVKNGADQQHHYKFSTVIGYFLQDTAATHPGTFDAMKENFGLIEQDYDTDKLLPANGKDLTQWQRFAHHLETMNKRAPKNVSYRLLYLGRHGQGYHNVGAVFYGDEAWTCYYSAVKEDPNFPSVRFFDADLTKLGRYEAARVFHFWNRMIATQKLPLPQAYYCSPLSRAIQTSHITFANLPLPATAPFKPVIKELLRETHGIHTCDERNSRTHLQEKFPLLRFEDGFTENDEIASETLRETARQHMHRSLRLLDDVFANDDSTYISMTCHWGTITATLAAVGHRPFGLPTGGVIPVVVKVEEVEGARMVVPGSDDDWMVKPDCRSDPMKAGLPGYKNIGEYVKEIEMNTPKDPAAA